MNPNRPKTLPSFAELQGPNLPHQPQKYQKVLTDKERIISLQAEKIKYLESELNRTVYGQKALEKRLNVLETRFVSSDQPTGYASEGQRGEINIVNSQGRYGSNTTTRTRTHIRRKCLTPEVRRKEHFLTLPAAGSGPNVQAAATTQPCPTAPSSVSGKRKFAGQQNPPVLHDPTQVIGLRTTTFSADADEIPTSSTSQSRQLPHQHVTHEPLTSRHVTQPHFKASGGPQLPATQRLGASHIFQQFNQPQQPCPPLSEKPQLPQKPKVPPRVSTQTSRVPAQNQPTSTSVAATSSNSSTNSSLTTAAVTSTNSKPSSGTLYHLSTKTTTVLSSSNTESDELSDSSVSTPDTLRRVTIKSTAEQLSKYQELQQDRGGEVSPGDGREIPSFSARSSQELDDHSLEFENVLERTSAAHSNANHSQTDPSLSNRHQPLARIVTTTPQTVPEHLTTTNAGQQIARGHVVHHDGRGGIIRSGQGHDGLTHCRDDDFQLQGRNVHIQEVPVMGRRVQFEPFVINYQEPNQQNQQYHQMDDSSIGQRSNLSGSDPQQELRIETDLSSLRSHQVPYNCQNQTGLSELGPSSQLTQLSQSSQLSQTSVAAASDYSSSQCSSLNVDTRSETYEKQFFSDFDPDYEDEDYFTSSSPFSQNSDASLDLIHVQNPLANQNAFSESANLNPTNQIAPFPSQPTVLSQNSEFVRVTRSSHAGGASNSSLIQVQAQVHSESDLHAAHGHPQIVLSSSCGLPSNPSYASTNTSLCSQPSGVSSNSGSPTRNSEQTDLVDRVFARSARQLRPDGEAGSHHMTTASNHSNAGSSLNVAADDRMSPSLSPIWQKSDTSQSSSSCHLDNQDVSSDSGRNSMTSYDDSEGAERASNGSGSANGSHSHGHVNNDSQLAAIQLQHRHSMISSCSSDSGNLSTCFPPTTGPPTKSSYPHPAHTLKMDRTNATWIRQADPTTKREYRIGLTLFNKDAELGIVYLVNDGFVDPNADAVAKFLLERRALSKQVIGEYMGNLRSDFAQQVLRSYMSQIDVTGLTIDGALRRVVANFRLPGESQKIERIMEVFAEHYLATNSQFANQFHSCDTVFLLSYAIIMLNTDLHNTQIRADKKMKLGQFIKNLAGIDGGLNVDEGILESVYQSVKEQPLGSAEDHVSQIARLEDTIIGSKKPKIALPFRRLVCYCRLSEVPDVDRKEKSGGEMKHIRDVFLFNDLLLVTKAVTKKKVVQYNYRGSYPLFGTQLHLIHTQSFPFAFRLSSLPTSGNLGGGSGGGGATTAGGARFSVIFAARNDHDRMHFVQDLRESIIESNELDIIKTDYELAIKQHDENSPILSTAVVSASGAGEGGGNMSSLRHSRSSLRKSVFTGSLENLSTLKSSSSGESIPFSNSRGATIVRPSKYGTGCSGGSGSSGRRHHPNSPPPPPPHDDLSS